MKILLLVGTLVALAGAHSCPSGKFWSHELDECILCSKCLQSYLVKPCDRFNDTVCSDEIKLSLNWLHPRVHHLKKERIHFFGDDEDNEEEIDSDESEHDCNDKTDNDLEGKHKKKEQHFHFDALTDFDFEKSKHKKHKHLDFDSDSGKKLHKKLLHKYWGDTESSDESELYSDEQKTLEKWLLDSKRKLKHRKDDFIKTLKGTQQKEDKKFRLNHPNGKMFTDMLDDLVKHEMHVKKENAKNKPENEFDVDLFRDLVHSNSEKRKEDTLEFMKLLSNPEVSNLNYKSVVPTHRMFLGEPSTVSEIIGQVKDGQSLFKPDYSKNVVLEKSSRSRGESVEEMEPGGEVMSVPFTAAETLVWDWQAVALVSAVGACLLFFVVAAIYILLTSRDTRSKVTDQDAEEMTTMVALMPTEVEKLDEDFGRKHRPIVIKPKLSHDYDQSYIHKTSR